MPTTLNRRSTDESLNLFRETVRRVVDEQLVARREGSSAQAWYIATSGGWPGTPGCCARRRRGADGEGSAGRPMPRSSYSVARAIWTNVWSPNTIAMRGCAESTPAHPKSCVRLSAVRC